MLRGPPRSPGSDRRSGCAGTWTDPPNPVRMPDPPLAAAGSEHVAAVGDVTAMHEVDLGPGQQLDESRLGVGSGHDHRIHDPPLCAVGAEYLLPVPEAFRVAVPLLVTGAFLGVDEHRTGLGVRA